MPQAEREESFTKQVLEDSERDLINVVQQIFKKNNKVLIPFPHSSSPALTLFVQEMLAVITSAYVTGLQAFFATGVEKVHDFKASLHKKMSSDDPHDPDQQEDGIHLRGCGFPFSRLTFMFCQST